MVIVFKKILRIKTIAKYKSVEMTYNIFFIFPHLTFSLKDQQCVWAEEDVVAPAFFSLCF